MSTRIATECDDCSIDFGCWSGFDPCRKKPIRQTELATTARLQEENNALKARLEAMRPVPPVSDWLAVELHNARFWCARTRIEPSAENLAKREWLETILGEPIESDPWKDRRGK